MGIALRRVITVDGLAASGKSSIAKQLAQRLGYVYFSSGILYRGVGALALRAGTDLNDGEALGRLVASHEWQLRNDSKGNNVLFLDGIPFGPELFTPEGSEAASRVAVFPEVRDALLEPQRQAFSPASIVGEGRDLGTVLFPQADLKLFVQVPEEVRVERRLAQWASNHGQVPSDMEAAIRREIAERDRRDAERSLAPTVAAPDAVIIDNSTAALTEIVQKLYHLALQRGLVAE
jgi:cytidylate kinase